MLRKPHILKMNRYQTSVGRDLVIGVRLDRNERVSDFGSDAVSNIFDQFSPSILTASPDAGQLYDAISKSVGKEVEQIFLQNGITECIRVLYDLGCGAGDNVVCIEPTYPMYKLYAEMYGIEFRPLTFNSSNLRLQIDSLSGLIDSRTRFVFLPNPNLPIESCLSVAEVRSIADQCATRNVFLVVDEAYYLFGGPTVIDLIEDCSNLIVLRTFSKAYGLAGLRIGFMVSKQETIAYLSKSRSLVECNSMSMAIATYMLENPQLMQEHVREVADGARTIKDILKNNQIPFFGGDVTNAILILLPDSSAPAELANFLREQNVYVRANFDEPIKNAVRVSIAPPEIMTVVGNQIVQFFQR